MRITTPLGDDVLLLKGLRGREEVSRLFGYELSLLSTQTSVSFDAIVGKSATVSLLMADGGWRHINGVIGGFSQGGWTGNLTNYAATLVPWTWLLTRTSDCRIFQNLTAPDIIQRIFDDFGFKDYSNRLHGSFATREFCVQYRETAFDFVSRLMEEEGVFYFFEHEEDKHTLVLADSPAEFRPNPHEKEIHYETSIGADATRELVSEWRIRQGVTPGKFTALDYDFEKPLIDLTATADAADERKYEVRDYPGVYKTRDEGERLVGIRAQELDVPRVVAAGASTYAALASGYRLDLKGHYRRDQNRTYVFLAVEHEADLGDSYETGSPGAPDEGTYSNRFECVPHPTPFRPGRLTPVPTIKGSQTAVVVGTKGEEIYTDQHGRVKVQFHWDRDGKYDEGSSCWIRVSQNWAGKRWGAVFLPRVGQEVIVDFLEGNPDRPIITGRVYNGASMPPYALPDEMTKSAVKSYSSKGGGGFNELRFEDKKGDEQVFVHAEKDLDVRVKNDRREWIGQDRHLIVKRDKFEEIEGRSHTTVDGDQLEKIKGDDNLKVMGKQAVQIGQDASLKVGTNLHQKTGMNHAIDAGMTVHIKGGMTVVIEAGVQLSLKVGGNFIDINPAGVFIQGMMVMINSGGAAGAGPGASPVAPTDPTEALEAVNADPGEMIDFQKKLAERSTPKFEGGDGPRHNQNSDENKEKEHWIEIELVDEAGKPVTGESVAVTLPDGSVASATTNDQGVARVEHFDPGGSCQITFVNLDKEAVEEG
jgi:type VI secretion system secreted protein VgrG